MMKLNSPIWTIPKPVMIAVGARYPDSRSTPIVANAFTNIVTVVTISTVPTWPHRNSGATSIPRVTKKSDEKPSQIGMISDRARCPNSDSSRT
ncbi:MAG: hypothetical protein QF909_12485, partial [SAR202 cluster bacterium]|nr:hypothetical protein [SAR202 cluster bacterium]